MIYFDNASTTKIHPEVLRTYNEILDKYYANPSGMHTFAREVARLQDKAREELLRMLKFRDGKVIFTSGATEANNIAIIGLYETYKNRGNEIIISDYEHPSVREACAYLQQERGAIIHKVPIRFQGGFDFDVFKSLLNDKTILVSVMVVNNEVGDVIDLGKIRDCLKPYPKVIFHSDVTQAMGKLEYHPNAADAYSFSAHKIGGLKGSGALILRNNLQPKPLVHGGGQEEGIRPGTHNAPANIVLAKTVRIAKGNIDNHFNHVYPLKLKLHNFIAQYKDLFVINSLGQSNPYIFNFSLKTIKASIVLNALENRGIYVGTTSSCSAKLHTMSQSVYAISHDEERASNSIRVSFGMENTLEEVDIFCKALIEIIKEYSRE